MWKYQVLGLFLLIACATGLHSCVHDDFAQNVTKHFLNDLTDHRLLTKAEDGR